ncbi:hypothetical protein F2P81_021072 [Scophthalmus maximus]|uniref:Uncharacterized protein n=1 Tax=Scophthalmus maximus TaxID=52904 RepID=A0A6A4S290_SCOMX|nr:hypothetical protein F2P81_021072 [Scophthalmus maximus]
MNISRALDHEFNHDREGSLLKDDTRREFSLTNGCDDILQSLIKLDCHRVVSAICFMLFFGRPVVAEQNTLDFNGAVANNGCEFIRCSTIYSSCRTPVILLPPECQLMTGQSEESSEFVTADRKQ